jgi:hypothetical protein
MHPPVPLLSRSLRYLHPLVIFPVLILTLFYIPSSTSFFPFSPPLPSFCCSPQPNFYVSPHPPMWSHEQNLGNVLVAPTLWTPQTSSCSERPWKCGSRPTLYCDQKISTHTTVRVLQIVVYCYVVLLTTSFRLIDKWLFCTYLPSAAQASPNETAAPMLLLLMLTRSFLPVGKVRLVQQRLQPMSLLYTMLRNDQVACPCLCWEQWQATGISSYRKAVGAPRFSRLCNVCMGFSFQIMDILVFLRLPIRTELPTLSELPGFWTLSIARYSRNHKTTFRKLALFPSSGDGEPFTLLSPLGRANLHHRTDIDSISECLKWKCRILSDRVLYYSSCFITGPF